jgi:hypothetical protein
MVKQNSNYIQTQQDANFKNKKKLKRIVIALNDNSYAYHCGSQNSQGQDTYSKILSVYTSGKRVSDIRE